MSKSEMSAEEKKRWTDEAFNFLRAYLKVTSEDLEEARSKTFLFFGKKKVRQLEEEVGRSKKAVKDLKNGKSALAIEIINGVLSVPSISPFKPPPPVSKFLDICRHEAALLKIKEALTP